MVGVGGSWSGEEGVEGGAVVSYEWEVVLLGIGGKIQQEQEQPLPKTGRRRIIFVFSSNAPLPPSNYQQCSCPCKLSLHFSRLPQSILMCRTA